MNADNVIVLSFSILFVIYAIVEILNVVANVKVRNTYSEYRDLIKEQNDLLIQDIHYLKHFLELQSTKQNQIIKLVNKDEQN